MTDFPGAVEKFEAVHKNTLQNHNNNNNKTTTTTIIIKHLTDFPGAVEKFEAVQAKWGGEASLV